jgi:hypothetical protein
MSVLTTAVISWVAFNSIAVAALLARRSRPELRERLFKWVVRGATTRRFRASHAHPRRSRA